MSIMETIKEHPGLTVGGVIAVLVIVFVISRSGGSSGAVMTGSAPPATDPNAAALAAASIQGQVQLQTSQMGADVASQQVAANLHVVDSNNATAQNIAAIQTKGATDIAALSAKVSSDNIAANESVALNGQQTQLEMQQAAYAAQTAQLNIQANAILGTQAIAAGVATHQADVNEAMFHDQQVSQIQIATIAGEAAKQVAITNAATQQEADTSTWIREQFAMPYMLQAAQSQGAYNLAIAQTVGGTQVAIAQAQNPTMISTPFGAIRF